MVEFMEPLCWRPTVALGKNFDNHDDAAEFLMLIEIIYGNC